MPQANPILLDLLDQYERDHMVAFSVWETMGSSIINMTALARFEITRDDDE